MIITQEEWHHISLFSLISSLEKSLCCEEISEERRVKREEYKKKKPLMRLFFLVHLTGVEPAHRRYRILNPARLPIPPQVLLLRKDIITQR